MELNMSGNGISFVIVELESQWPIHSFILHDSSRRSLFSCTEIRTGVNIIPFIPCWLSSMIYGEHLSHLRPYDDRYVIIISANGSYLLRPSIIPSQAE